MFRAHIACLPIAMSTPMSGDLNPSVIASASEAIQLRRCLDCFACARNDVEIGHDHCALALLPHAQNWRAVSHRDTEGLQHAGKGEEALGLITPSYQLIRPRHSIPLRIIEPMSGSLEIICIRSARLVSSRLQISSSNSSGA